MIHIHYSCCLPKYLHKIKIYEWYVSANLNNIFGLLITHSFTNSIQRPSSRSKRQAIEVEKTEHDGLSGEPGEAEQEGSGEPEVAKKGGGVSLGKILGNFKVLYPK